MSAAETALTVGTWLFLHAVGLWVVSTVRVSEWATEPAGSAWTRRLGVLALVVTATATGAFSVHPPLGVYLLVAAGALAYAAGTLAAAGAARTALAAVAPDGSFGGRVRAFWFAAAAYYRWTRVGFGVALVAFLLAALVAALSVDAFVSAAGALALGGVLACVGSLAAVGVFAPSTRNEAVAEAVHRARS